MVVRDDSALLTQLRIETANDLVTIQMEVKPLLASGAFQTSEDLLVEAPSFGDISDLHAYFQGIWRSADAKFLACLRSHFRRLGAAG